MLSKECKKKELPIRIGLFKNLLLTLEVPMLVLFMNNYKPEERALFYDFTTLEDIDLFTKIILGNQLDKLNYLLNHESILVSEKTLLELILISIKASNKEAFKQILNFAVRHNDSAILLILIQACKSLSQRCLPIDPFISKEIDYYQQNHQLPLNKTLNVDDKWFYFKSLLKHIEGFVVVRINNKSSLWMSHTLGNGRVYPGNLNASGAAQSSVLIDVDIDKIKSKKDLVDAVAQFIKRTDLSLFIKLIHESTFRTVVLYDTASILSAILSDRTLSKFKAFLNLFVPFYEKVMTRIDLCTLLNLHALPRPLDEQSLSHYEQMIELVFSANRQPFNQHGVDLTLMSLMDSLVLEDDQKKLPFESVSNNIFTDEKSQYVRLFTQIGTYPGFEKAGYLILREPQVLSSLQVSSITQILNYAFKNKLPKLINIFAYFKHFHFDSAIFTNGNYPAGEVLCHLLTVFDNLSYEALILYLPLLEEEQARPYRASLFNNEEMSKRVQYYGSVDEFSRFWTKLVARVEFCLTIFKPKSFLLTKSCLMSKAKKEHDISSPLHAPKAPCKRVKFEIDAS